MAVKIGHFLFWLPLLVNSIPPHFGYKNPYCSFEEDCSWEWNSTVKNGFKKMSGEEYYNKYVLNISTEDPLLYTDADNKTYGHFLVAFMPMGRQSAVQIRSPIYRQADADCAVQVDLKMINMTGTKISLVIETNVDVLVRDLWGNDENTWRTHILPLGEYPQPFRLLLEAEPIKIIESQLFMDNLNLVNCFPDMPTSKACNPKFFRCSIVETDYCVNTTQLCDIQTDCLNEADENQSYCHLIPNIARCSFEDDMCGWENTMGATFNWTRTSGSGNLYSGWAGPPYDNTFQNLTGKFLFVNMSSVKNAVLGDFAKLKSSLFNPPPKYHSNPNSVYYKTCLVRFFYFHEGNNVGSITLTLKEMDPRGVKSFLLWESYGSHGKIWRRHVSVLPRKMLFPYHLEFEAQRGLKAFGNIAIDDVSLSPECFGLNVPENIKQGYNYDKFKGFEMPTKPLHEHRDFANKTNYFFTTCGANGRFGPTQEKCDSAYNNTNTKVTVLQRESLKGIQRWLVPEDNFYTIIVKGASGGKGDEGTGISKGSIVAGVVKLNKNQPLYILVGQKGGDACRKTFAVTKNYTCSRINKIYSKKPISTVRELQELTRLDIRDGGGGGGATVVFLWPEKQGKIPLMVGAGGGGIGGGNNADDGSQNGNGQVLNQPGVTGSEQGYNLEGAGGGWNESDTWQETTGRSFTRGASGGKACNNTVDDHGAGGFGGGGGGCLSGGGGGGFAGGSASSDRRSGQGGYSYIDPEMVPSQIFPGSNTGHGSVIIIPAVEGCGCDYLCVALDEFRQNIRCICPRGSLLKSDGISCYFDENFYSFFFEKGMLVILSIAVGIFLVIMFIYILCFMIVKQQSEINNISYRANVLCEPGTNIQLLPYTTKCESNPIYSFGSNRPTEKDLNEIPRENISLIKCLGKGEFGEVHQGIMKTEALGIKIQLPIAVKMLTGLVTAETERQFKSEAVMMCNLVHPNIVRMYGVCFRGYPKYIILEMLPGGDLKNFLLRSRPKPGIPSALTMRDLIKFSYEVSLALLYLEENQFTHNDIACRNILLSSIGPGRTVKIADFGLARDVFGEGAYRKRSKCPLPIRWMAPEAFRDNLFTYKSDVWSFGVFLWEVQEFGGFPYSAMNNEQVLDQVIKGKRLKKPSNCPQPLYDLMLDCWQADPKDRPNFREIVERLRVMLENKEIQEMPLPPHWVFPPFKKEEKDTNEETSEADANDTRNVSKPNCCNVDYSKVVAEEKTEIISVAEIHSESNKEIERKTPICETSFIESQADALPMPLPAKSTTVNEIKSGKRDKPVDSNSLPNAIEKFKIYSPLNFLKRKRKNDQNHNVENAECKNKTKALSFAKSPQAILEVDEEEEKEEEDIV